MFLGLLESYQRVEPSSDITDKIEVDKLSKILIKISNAAEFFKSDIQNIEAPRTDDPII